MGPGVVCMTADGDMVPNSDANYPRDAQEVPGCLLETYQLLETGIFSGFDALTRGGAFVFGKCTRTCTPAWIVDGPTTVGDRGQKSVVLSRLARWRRNRFRCWRENEFTECLPARF